MTPQTNSRMADRQHQEAVVEREIDQAADHGAYCSTVFCKTSALETTCWPGAMPGSDFLQVAGSIVCRPSLPRAGTCSPPAGT